MLERQLPDPEQKAYTRVIIEEADRLAALVDGILRAGGAPRPEEVNLHRITEHVAQLIEAEKPARVELVRDYDPSLPAITRRSQSDDSGVLERRAQRDAGASASSGRLIFRTRALSNFTVGGEQHRLVLSAEVEDNGPGIPDELKETIFYPLVTGRPTGTGLGLTIAQDLVSRNGGLIEFTSQPGRTVFQIRAAGRDTATRRARTDGDAGSDRVGRRRRRVGALGARAGAEAGAHDPALLRRPARSSSTALERERPDVLVTDIRMPDMSGLELMERLARTDPDIPVIVITAHSDLDSAVSAYQGGAFEYLPKPFDIDEAMELVSRAARQRSRDAAEQTAAKPTPRIIGQAPAMQEVFKAIGRLSRSSMTVLITGESGTGKELVARALHDNSPRATAPFVALNTSAIAAELLESELFGHEKGAFTGATERRIGRFEQANGGTLFLDEIGDMSLALQTRLLRVLAESEFFRVGGQTAIRVDVRVIAATHQDLAQGAATGRFREDLYHRLNVMRIEVPPLRQRREDIRELSRFYLEQAANELGVAPKTLSADAIEALQRYDWPGNVRELVNVCRRLTVTAAGREIVAQDLPAELGGVANQAGADWTTGLSQWAEGAARDRGAARRY